MRRFYPLVLLGLALSWATACGPIINIGTAQPPTLIMQRGAYDCAVAAVAMVDHTSYGAVDTARKQLGINPDLDGGIAITDIVALAGRLGVRLYPEPDLPANGEGIAVVWMLPGPNAIADDVIHAVYVKDNMVYDPLDSVPEPYPLALARWHRVIKFLKRMN